MHREACTTSGKSPFGAWFGVRRHTDGSAPGRRAAVTRHAQPSPAEARDLAAVGTT